LTYSTRTVNLQEPSELTGHTRVCGSPYGNL